MSKTVINARTLRWFVMVGSTNNWTQLLLVGILSMNLFSTSFLCLKKMDISHPTGSQFARLWLVVVGRSAI
jgi:hypothetical protein